MSLFKSITLFFHMGSENDSLENKISFDQESLKKLGLENYTNEFKNSNIPDESFGGIYNQDKPIRDFFRALNSKYRAILNLGSCGVGKSTFTNEFFGKLKELSKGNTIKGNYSEKIITIFNRLGEHQHKDIISLWNPSDYNKPIIIKISSEDWDIEDFIEDVENVTYKTRMNIQSKIDTSLASFATEECLKEAINFVIEKDFDKIDVSFDKKDNAYSIQLDGDVNEDINEKFNRKIEDFHKWYNNSPFRIGRKKQKIWKNTFSRVPAILEEKMDSDLDKTVFNESLEEILNSVEELNFKWKKVPELSDWLYQVKNFILDNKNIKKMKKEFNNNLSSFRHDLRRSVGSKKLEKYDPPKASLNISVTKEKFELEELLTPGLLYDSRDDSGPILRNLAGSDYGEIFGYLLEDDLPIHRNIELGALATSDILILDDGLLSFLKKEDFRRSMLSFLQDGTVSILYNKTEVSLFNDCYFIVNDTEVPFYKQDFEGTDPDFDEAMARRFNIVKWNNFIENTPESRKNFPLIIKKSFERYKNRNKIKEEVEYTPEAINTFFQYLLSETNQNIIPLQIGIFEKELLEPVTNEVLSKRRNQVNPEDIISFLEDQRDLLSENCIRDSEWENYTNKEFRPLIGTGNGLSVYGYNLGGISYINANVVKIEGKIESTDSSSKLTDGTHVKGVLNSSDWFQGSFGECHSKITYSFNGFEEHSGPSASSMQTYALMSAIGEIPIKQNIFVTGTILDKFGNVGAIGGVYEKTRGAYLFYSKEKRVDPCIVMVPKPNVTELLRKIQFDTELTNAISEEKLILMYHENIWQGFHTMSGLSREVYEPKIRDNLIKINKHVLNDKDKYKKSFFQNPFKKY